MIALVDGMKGQAPTSGFSDAARALNRMLSEAREHRGRSATVNKRCDEINAVLNNLRQQSEEELGSVRDLITTQGYRDLSDALSDLPLDFELPDVMVDSSGAILAEWYRSVKQLIVVKFKGNGSVYYASISRDGRRSSGSMPLVSGLPEKVTKEIVEVLG